MISNVSMQVQQHRLVSLENITMSIYITRIIKSNNWTWKYIRLYVCLWNFFSLRQKYILRMLKKKAQENMRPEVIISSTFQLHTSFLFKSKYFPEHFVSKHLGNKHSYFSECNKTPQFTMWLKYWVDSSGKKKVCVQTNKYKEFVTVLILSSMYMQYLHISLQTSLQFLSICHHHLQQVDQLHSPAHLT